MNAWMLLLGAAMLALVTYDVVVTTISTTSAGGPLTSRFAYAWWRMAHRLARGPASKWLSSAGPTILLGTIGLWLLLLWGGWTLVFAADTSAVVSGTSQASADWWSRVYFAGFTVFTLGMGDYVPVGAPWQVLTVMASASGLAITTASITYLIPVVTAATQRAQLAARIDVMGGDTHQLVVNLFHDGSVAQFGELLPELTDRLLQTGERHLTYPILHYFHPRSAETDLRVQLAALDDAITLVQFGLIPEVVRPHPAVTQAARSAIAHLLEQAHVADVEEATPLDLAPLRTAGLPVAADEEFQQAVAGLEEHRLRVAGYAAESKWHRSAA